MRQLAQAPSARYRCIHPVRVGQTCTTKHALTCVVLDDLLGHKAPEQVSLAWLMGRLGDRSFGIALLLLAPLGIALVVALVMLSLASVAAWEALSATGWVPGQL
jgi:hypothetical protein